MVKHFVNLQINLLLFSTPWKQEHFLTVLLLYCVLFFYITYVVGIHHTGVRAFKTAYNTFGYIIEDKKHIFASTYFDKLISNVNSRDTDNKQARRYRMQEKDMDRVRFRVENPIVDVRPQ